MKITTYGYTNKGSRPVNEDFFDYVDNHVWVLADGLGGHDCGEIASKMAVEYTITQTSSSYDRSDEALIDMMNNVNSHILNQQTVNPSFRSMRTTIAAAFVQDNIFRHFHVGDSRVYYFKKGEICMQTRDHSVTEATFMLGQIEENQIRFHEDRNKLMKVLGNSEDLKISKISSGIPVEIGDAFILCSDGFWEHVLETEMEIDLHKSTNPRMWGEFMIKRLIHRVYQMSGDRMDCDNYTIICCIAEKES